MAAPKRNPRNPNLRVVKSRKPRVTIKELRAEIDRLKAKLRPTKAVALTAVAMPLMGGALGWLATTFLAQALATPTRWDCWLLAVLCGAMTYHGLRVSLPHVRLGIERQLKLDRREARSLAIVFDLAALTGEVVLHAKAAGEAPFIAGGLMVFGLVASIAFNLVGLRPESTQDVTS